MPGAELDFTLYGTPGGRAALSIAGARRNLNLVETNPGQYEGTYTLSTRDRVTANSRVTANLRVANLVTSGVLSESLLRAPGQRRAARDARDGRDARDYAANAPRIEKFQAVGSTELRDGNDLSFAVYGTPGAKVDMSITGARGTFFLPEVAPGEYRGDYVIRRADNIRPNSVVVANLRINNRVVSATLAQPLQAMPAIQPVAQTARYCTNCATIESVNVVEVTGDGNYLGTIGGGVLGAVLGSQVGKGSGKTAAQIAGALGGAYIGRNIERNAKKTNHYEVLVRFQNGGTQTVTYENDPGVRVGEKVRVNDGVLTRDQ
ncbi:glycine zipper 2TM domain-containing protein [Massilia glaciei]|uniref:glycine zipper 2TM domain-containing protein n=1 Tax=Massilia glaciei TaxID=1524097 RepID=UPI0011B20DCA|nr:glycine zipper 2TM domain-containing protein [Massilia glaciei]